MEAVYTLLDVERGVPEVFASCYDVRFLLKATIYLLDHRKLSELHLPLFAKFLERVTVKELKHTDVEELLEKYRLV
jgi:oleate hydratase